MSNHWRVYEPIPDVAVRLDDDTLIGGLEVTACTDGSDSAPISIGPYSLTLAQSAALRAILERAEQDVLRGVEQDPPEVSCG